jgi:hypothetical protein
MVEILKTRGTRSSAPFPLSSLGNLRVSVSEENRPFERYATPNALFPIPGKSEP